MIRQALLDSRATAPGYRTGLVALLFPDRANACVPQPFIKRRDIFVLNFEAAGFQCRPLRSQFLQPIYRWLIHTRDVALGLIDQK